MLKLSDPQLWGNCWGYARDKPSCISVQMSLRLPLLALSSYQQLPPSPFPAFLMPLVTTISLAIPACVTAQLTSSDVFVHLLSAHAKPGAFVLSRWWSSSEFPFAMSQVQVLSMDPPGTRAPPKAPFNCTGLRYFHSPGPCAVVELGLGQTRFPLCGLIPRGFFVSQGRCKGSEGTWRLSHCPLVKQPRWGARRTPPSPSVVLFENCSRGAKHL